jgi:uracil-DNA glycosylase
MSLHVRLCFEDRASSCYRVAVPVNAGTAFVAFFSLWHLWHYSMPGVPLTAELQHHVQALAACRKCPQMRSTPVSGGPVRSKVMLIGQAPGVREPLMGRPFAWTAGKTMFKWFWETVGISETEFRATVYMAAVCRCFPGRGSQGGDRVPSRQEIENCSTWMQTEFALLKPELVICVGRLAIGRFVEPLPPLHDLIGKLFPAVRWGHRFDLVPLPHPSGASPWPRVEPGKSLTRTALELIRDHPAWRSRTDFPRQETHDIPADSG